MNNQQIAVKILLNAGFNKKLGHYEKCGVSEEDLNVVHLLSVFNDLDHMDHLYSLEFYKLVNNMKTLGAKEFIINFVKFARNDFSTEDLQLLDTLNRHEGMRSMFDMCADKTSNWYKVYTSTHIKNEFNENVLPYVNQTKGLYSVKNMERKVGYPHEVR